MKRLWPLTLLVGILACTTPADDMARATDAAPDLLAPYAPSAAARADVVATLQVLFDALETGDEELLRSVLDPSVVMHFSETRDGVTTLGRSTVDALAERIRGSAVPLIERMWDPIVLVSGSLATVWAPYDFYSGEAFSHCGVDTANLMQTEDGWKIVALSWTRLQPPECSRHPDGPPA